MAVVVAVATSLTPTPTPTPIEAAHLHPALPDSGWRSRPADALLASASVLRRTSTAVPENLGWRNRLLSADS